MIKKIFKSLFAIYLIQLVGVACETDDCDCPTPQTFERTFNSVELQALDFAEIPVSEVDGSLDRAFFGLNIAIAFEQEQIAVSCKKSGGTNLGFAAAYACSCLADQFISIDPIASLTIQVTDTQTMNTTDITGNFSYNGQQGQLIEVIKSFENSDFWPDGFQLQLDDSENIPDTSIFTITVDLASGTELTAQTQEINFE
jgi:hypothetical protein